ncbi:hypothetical protein [Bradyrhizobium retamae]|uniref:hypothetical protein n=1 Tax=Bradyrhizobium retamae TaxID=1300035 RepID=UPI000AACDD80|nr:hypothetical protein [Bradyrhizobium retamae]
MTTDEQLEKMCRAHHKVRTAQGFTTAPWDALEERNREQYREAMRAAVGISAVSVQWPQPKFYLPK